MTGEAESVRRGAEDVLEALRGVAVRVQGARELEDEADGGGVGIGGILAGGDVGVDVQGTLGIDEGTA